MLKLAWPFDQFSVFWEGFLMTTTLIGEPGDMDRDSEIIRGIAEAEDYLRGEAERLNVLDVGGSIVEIVETSFRRRVGNAVMTGYIMPRRDTMREISNGVHYLN